MKNIYLLMIAVFSLTLFNSCSKDDPEIPNEEELITTLIWDLEPIGNKGQPVEFKFKDIDGDGGSDPVITGGPINQNEDYNCTLTLLNEASNPVEDITNEIKSESAEHQFFFRRDGNLDVQISYEDEDTDGNPLGLATRLSVGSIGTGTITITLRHEPDKMADGVSEGNIFNAGGETDIEVTFDIDVIQ